MKVLVAHNRYSSAQPSGENTIVDLEIEQLRAAGVAVVAFLRSSDEISHLPLARRALLPVSPVYAGHAQRELRALLREHRPDVVHLHNPYPLLSPWVVRTAHAARSASTGCSSATGGSAPTASGAASVRRPWCTPVTGDHGRRAPSWPRR